MVQKLGTRMHMMRGAYYLVRNKKTIGSDAVTMEMWSPTENTEKPDMMEITGNSRTFCDSAAN